ncbi:MAG: hypothetical protein Q9201_000839 [Fulgogasparrea decipioides]
MSGLTSPVKTCNIDNKPLANGVTAQSGCNGGTSFMCSDQSPWAVNDDLAYGFAAVTASNPTCCTCYKLTFTSTSIMGKTMIVQATNTGNDVSGTQFDLAIPGGGFGQFDGCSKQWNATSSVWGAQYGGSNTNNCSSFPAALKPGCDFRWDWMQGQSNPTVNYETVACPAEIVAKSGCSVSGYSAPGPSNPNPSSSSEQPTTGQQTALATMTTSTATEAPTSTEKASDVSSMAAQGTSVIDVKDSPVTGISKTTWSVSDRSYRGSPTTSATGAGETGGAGKESVEEGEDDTCVM